MSLRDTHVWLWWLLGSDQLPNKERDDLDRLAARGGLRVAAVSLPETQMLHTKTRLALNRPFDIWIHDAATAKMVQIHPRDSPLVVGESG